MLRVELIGNLGSDPETRFSAGGNKVLQFRVAVNSVKGQGEDRRERTDWFRVSTMGGKADYLERALRKGSRVLVLGRFEIGSYTHRETGELRTTYDVWADEVQNLTPRDRDESDGQAPVAAAAAPTIAFGQQPSGRQSAEEDIDALPF